MRAVRMKHKSKADDVISQIRKLPETKLHTKIVIPLLKSIGFSHIRYLHGSAEKGKDLCYIVEDNFGDKYLEVCQVKNEPFSGKAIHANNTISTLTQLRQCKNIEVFNPLTTKNELPQSAVLMTTYPLPDKDIQGASKLLDELHRERCKIVTPEKFIELIKLYLSEEYNSYAFPGKGLSKKLCSYVSIHREAIAFGLQQRNIDEFYINIGFKPVVDFSNFNKTGEGTFRRFQENIEIHKKAYETFSSMISVLPSIFQEEPIIELDDPYQPDTWLISKKFFPEKHLGKIFEKHISKGKSAKSKKINLNIIFGAEYLTKFLLSSYGATLIKEYNKLSNVLSDQQIQETNSESFLTIRDNLCIVGKAGSGKTTFSRMLLIKGIENGLNCLYVPCSLLNKKNKTIDAAIDEFLKMVSPNSKQSCIRKYKETAPLIILDGCDESAGFETWLSEKIHKFAFPEKIEEKIKGRGYVSPNIPHDLKGKVKYIPEEKLIRLKSAISVYDLKRLVNLNSGKVEKALGKIMEKYKHLPKVILTTRTVRPLHLDSNYNYLHLEGFSDSQLKLFFEKLLLEKRKSDAVMEFLNTHDYIKEIARFPMTATIIASLYENGYDLPTSKTDLYHKRFDLLLDRWQRVKHLDDHNRVKPSDKMFLLSRLALKLHLNHQRRFTQQDVLEIWESGLSKHYPQYSCANLMSELEIYNGVISHEGGNEYTMGHLSYQEYLAANSIMMTQQQKFLVKQYFDPWWQNVIIFHAGLCGDVSSFLEEAQRKHPLVNDGGLLAEIKNEARFTSPITQDFLKIGLELDLFTDFSDDDGFYEDDDFPVK